ncbi:MAG: glycosyltransferase family 2 protein [Candidatus Kerfeldbacteria bacterium]|nr:glycosyltransferase family 2 protein [Candidatus Kerfeldbacteria bacterium]
MDYSVIVPILNERENIRELHRQILETMRGLEKPFEILFVDDGSTDGSFDVMQELAPLTIIRMRKSFGQTAAFDAGIRNAHGEVLITLDGDLQNPPSEIPKLLHELEKGFDAVCGWRKNRQDPPVKKFISEGAKFLRKFLVSDGVHDAGCSLRVYRRECFHNMQLLGEMHRFIPAILRWNGFRITEISVEHHPRLHGTSKYNYKRIPKGFLDMITVWFWRKYATRPLHLFGGLGLLLLGSGFLLGIALGILRAYERISLGQSNLPLFTALLILVGTQFLITGILSDILIRMYYKSDRSDYSIQSIHTRE